MLYTSFFLSLSGIIKPYSFSAWVTLSLFLFLLPPSFLSFLSLWIKPLVSLPGKCLFFLFPRPCHFSLCMCSSISTTSILFFTCSWCLCVFIFAFGLFVCFICFVYVCFCFLFVCFPFQGYFKKQIKAHLVEGIQNLTMSREIK